MHVLMIVQEYDSADPFAGFIVTWVNELAERLKHVSVMSLSVKQAPTRSNITIHSLGKELATKRFKKFRYLLNWHNSMRLIFSSNRPDLIFTHMTPVYSVLALPYALWYKIPIITWYSHPKIKFATRLSIFLSDLVVTAAPEIHAYAPSKTLITGNGVDLNAFQPAKNIIVQNPKIIVSIGRICPLKDYDTLIDAASILKSQLNQKFIIRILGAVKNYDLPYLASLKNKIKNLELDNYFEFGGERRPDQVPDEMKKAHVFVNSQPTGGFGKAVLEAMAVGLPPIVSTKAFETELGAWSKSLIYETSDPKSLADRLESILTMETSSLEKLKQRLIEIAHNHSLAALMDFLVSQMNRIRMGSNSTPGEFKCQAS